jgi:hypothetical protein
MNDVPDPPPNARLVRFAKRSKPFPAEATLLEPLDLDVSENPFEDLRTLSVLASSKDSHKCSHRLRAYLSELQPRTPAAGIRNDRRQLVGAYDMSIQGRSVFTAEQANPALAAAFNASAAGERIEFVFNRESRSDAVDFRHPPIQLSQLKRIQALRTVSGEGDSASVPATVAALEGACTVANLFETVCQIRGTNWMMLAIMNWCITSVVKLQPTSLHLVPSPVASSSSFLSGIYSLPRNGNNLTARWYYQYSMPCRDTWTPGHYGKSTSTRFSTTSISCTPQTSKVSTEVRSTGRSSFCVDKSTTSLSLVPILLDYVT